MSGAEKRGAALAVGDILGSQHGPSHTITGLTPYPNPHLFDFMDERWRIAHSGDWGMTVGPDDRFRQAANGVWATWHHVNTDGTWV